MPLIRFLCIMLLSIAIAACGGGGSLESPGGGSSDKYELDGVITGSDDGSGRITISKAQPGTLTVTLTKNGSPYANQIISFEIGEQGVGVLDPEVGTAQTNSSGVAEITLRAGTVPGTGSVTATFTPAEGTTQTKVANFTSLGDDDEGEVGLIDISLAISNTEVSAENPATIIATLTQDGKKVANKVVTFNTTLGVFSPVSGTALTNTDGIASIILTAGTVRGAGEVTASLSTGESSIVSFNTAGDDTGVVGDINIEMQLVDTEGNETDTITASKPGKVIATVNGISSPVIVTFTNTVGEIPIATAITDDDNQASVDILAGGSLGAGTITASIVSGETGEILLVVGSSTVVMGSGDPFVEGKADISLEQISAGGTTVVSVQILDDQNNLFTEAVTVNFSSGCTSLPTPSATLSSPITTSNGIATSTYLAKGCVGDDPINVTANAGGINLSASGIVNVLPADVGSIEFVSASPDRINILGTGSQGGGESSTVVFRVLDTNNNPVNNQLVNFELNTDVGGIKIIPTSGTTDNNGLVQTVINSGTVATSVRVQATIDGSSPQISSQSSLLVVSTGIPDQDSFSLSADILNPEGWDIDGTKVTVTARLADAFNNPAPDGTAVSFTTEGGSIEPSCTTVNGVCQVIWTSQNPRPEGHVLQHKTGDDYNWSDSPDEIHLPEVNNTMGQKLGGRANILATVIGEESFPDLNGNARFDASEMEAFLGNDISGRPYDQKEAFVDHNEDGLYNPAEGSDVNDSGALETFVDFNNDGEFSDKDGKYNGVLCSIPAHDGCANGTDNKKSINVRAQLTLVMSGSHAQLTRVAPADGQINISGEGSASASVIISDLHNQPMPAGTIITFSAAVGSVIAGSSYTWPNDNHNGGLLFPVTIKGEKEAKSGPLVVEITPPSGSGVSYSPFTININ